MPRRVSPSEETMRETPVAMIGNSVLLQIINETIGKEVLVETKDGNKFSGIFAGCSPETMDMGLRLAHQITTENEANLLPKKSEVEEKLQFKYTDVVCMSVLMVEEKTIKGFATDREYHEFNDSLGAEDDWKTWEGDDDSEAIDIMDKHIEEEDGHQHNRGFKNGGWNVNEMFSKNDQLGVKSTFEEDLSQYSTADVIDDPEARKKAEQIARQIEANASSKHNAFLENDDTERDLDKTTEEEEYGMNGRNNRRGPINSKVRGNGVPIATNKRAEALKDGRGPSIPNNRYVSGSYSGSNGKEYRDTLSTGKKEGKYDNSGFKGKVHLEQRAPSGSPRGSTSSELKEQGGAGRRVENLRDWNTHFSNNYQATKDVNSIAISEKSEDTRLSGNAWTKGPPTSLLISSQASPNATSSSPSQSVPSNEPSEPQPEQSENMEINESLPNEQSEESGEFNTHNDESLDENSGKPPGDPAHKPADSVKKFTFNLDAPSFVPKSVIPPLQPATQVVQVSQAPVVQQLPAMMGVQQASGGPPAMMVSAQPVVMQWPGGQQAVYQTTPQGYQYMVNNQPITSVRTQAGQVNPQMVQNAQGGSQQRRPAQGQQVYVQQQPTAYIPAAVYQTQPAVPVQQYYGSQYPNANVPPPQQYQSMAVAQGQGAAVSMAYVQQQRFVGQPGQQMYVMQPGVASALPRYPTPQGQQSHEQYQGQAASQPPTPGPQPPQPVPSPAQSVPLPSQSPAARTYSPHPMITHSAPPQHQQFYIPPQHIQQQQQQQQTAMYFGQQQQLFYQQQQQQHTAQMQSMAAQHAVAAAQQQQDGSNSEQMSTSSQIQQQPYMTPEQYGQQQQYMQQQGYFPQPPPPHLRIGNMGPQGQQFVQQQSLPGMQQAPPSQSQNHSQGPPQQTQQLSQ